MPQGNPHRALPAGDDLHIPDGHVGRGHADAARQGQAAEHRTSADHGHEPAVVVIPARSARDLPRHLPQRDPGRDTRVRAVREAAPVRPPGAVRERAPSLVHGCGPGGRFMPHQSRADEPDDQERGGDQGYTQNRDCRTGSQRDLACARGSSADVGRKCNRYPTLSYDHGSWLAVTGRVRRWAWWCHPLVRISTRRPWRGAARPAPAGSLHYARWLPARPCAVVGDRGEGWNPHAAAPQAISAAAARFIRSNRINPDGKSSRVTPGRGRAAWPGNSSRRGRTRGSRRIGRS